MVDATRRALVAAASLGLPMRWNATPASAQPGRAVETLRLLVPATPGGGWDGTAQVIAQVLRETGAVAAVRFEYRPGAGGALALPRLVVGLRARPDTLMVGGLTQVRSTIVNPIRR